jgi:hypothetical protein
MNCKEIEDKISGILLEKFSKSNFVLKKNIFEKSLSRKYQYVIDVKRSHNGYSLHLILKLLDKNISKGVNAILEKTLLDKEMEYPKNWTQKDIEYSIKACAKNNTILTLTDWRTFKTTNESLEEFNKKFSIWFCVYNEIEEKENWKEQLYTSFDFSKKWFEMVDNEEYIIENTIYESLYLLKTNNNMDYLSKRFKNIREICRDKKELKRPLNF